jgi:1-acyl-sn-glycerol-3-phosphate acyltransferase
VLLLRSLLFDALFYGTMILLGLLFLPAAALSRGVALWALKFWCRLMLRLLALICGLRTGVRGAVPSGEVLVVAKHQSFLDVLILVAHLPRPRFVMKASLARIPVFGFYARRIGCIPVERERGGAALRGLLAWLREERDHDDQIVIYPQGTRVAPGAAAPYKAGAAALYGAFARPAVPAATNAGAFWGRASLYRRPGLALVSFLPPIAPGEAPRAFLRRVEAAIEAETAALASGE